MMPKSIWKYVLEAKREQEIEMPRGSLVLSAHVQKEDDICIWVLVDSATVEKEARAIYVIPTGRAAGDMEDKQFISTVLMDSDRFVFHVFCDKKAREIYEAA